MRRDDVASTSSRRLVAAGNCLTKFQQLYFILQEEYKTYSSAVKCEGNVTTDFRLAGNHAKCIQRLKLTG